MSKFDELKKAAEAAIKYEYCDRFIERDDAQAVLDLLAIQAQLVEALQMAGFYVSGEGSHDEKFMVFTALSAAGAQP